MSWEYSEEDYKQYTKETWNTSAASYDPWIRALEPFNEPLLEAINPQPGDRILDVCTGPGEPALTLAKALGSQGHVLGIDLSDKMLEQAKKNADARKVTNVGFEVMDAENMTLDDASFDAVVSRSSLQILTNPQAALEEIARVLKPGGRFVASVWAAPGERSPALHAILGPMLMHCTPDATGYLPTPYELGGPHTLRNMVEKAGLEPTPEDRINVPIRFEDTDDYLQALMEGTPVGHSLEEENEQVQQAVLEETRANIERWNQSDDGDLVLGSEAVVVSATRPET